MTTIECDIYESRVSTTPLLKKRVEPVVYGNAEGPLDTDELEFFEKNGFLFFDSFLSGKELEEAIVAQKQLKIQQTYSNDPKTIFELENKEKKVRSIFDIHRSDSVFRKISQTPRIVQMVEQLLDSQVYIHQSRINYKPAFRGKEFYWHSDFETWHIEDGMPRMRAVSCSISLTENTSFNGALMVIPGSHKVFVSCVGQTPKDHFKASLKKQEYGVPDDKNLASLVKKHGIVSPLGGPGSLLLFDCNIMHGSNSNISPTSRTNLFYVYNSVENSLEEPFGKMHPRPDYIASRTVNPISL